MKIYTSYFGNLRNLQKAGIVPISIALWPPKWYGGACYYPVAPNAAMLRGGLTDAQYTKEYWKILKKLDVARTVMEIGWLSAGQDCALLCYEKPGDFCHRHLLAEWLLITTGLEVTEWESPDSKPKKAAVPKVEMPTLF